MNQNETQGVQPGDEWQDRFERRRVYYILMPVLLASSMQLKKHSEPSAYPYCSHADASTRRWVVDNFSVPTKLSEPPVLPTSENQIRCLCSNLFNHSPYYGHLGLLSILCFPKYHHKYFQTYGKEERIVVNIPMSII